MAATLSLIPGDAVTIAAWYLVIVVAGWTGGAGGGATAIPMATEGSCAAAREQVLRATPSAYNVQVTCVASGYKS